MCRYIYTLIISALLVCCSQAAFAQFETEEEDTTTAVKVKKKDMAGHQLMLGVEYFRPLLRMVTTDRNANEKTDRYAYELAASYYLHNEYYLAGEMGLGGCSVDYPDLQYKTTNTFLRFGFNKSILQRDKPDDWDMMFIGFGAGFANIWRGAAHYVVVDSLWGNRAETQAGNTFQTYWAEITGGVRVELLKNITVGWNIRGKFLMNGKSKSVKELAPVYIAGYGKGDKNSSFDLNMYISYAIRWKRKVHEPAVEEKPGIPTIVPPSAKVDSTNTNKAAPSGLRKSATER